MGLNNKQVINLYYKIDLERVGLARIAGGPYPHYNNNSRIKPSYGYLQPMVAKQY